MPSSVPRKLRATLATAFLISLLLVPATALAKPPTQEEQLRFFYDCDFVEADAGLAITGGFSDGIFSAPYFAFWETGTDPDNDPPTFHDVSSEVASATDVSVVWNVELGTFDEETGETTVLGSAVITAVGEAAGETTPINRKFKEGNIQVREVGVGGPISVDVEVTTDLGVDFSFTDCPGEAEDLVVWRTNPTTFVGKAEFAFFSCQLEDADGNVAFINAESFEDLVFVEVFTIDGAALFGFAPHEIAPGTASLSVPLEAEDGTPGTATLELTVVSEGTETAVQVFASSKTKVEFEFFSGSASLSVEPGGLTFDSSSCAGERQSFMDIVHPFTNPKGGGKAPPNDLPGGALPLGIGGKVNVKNGAAAEDAEAESFCAPLGRTVWYTVEGNGEPITVDTTGSNFDSVVAIYDEELIEVACNDDTDGGPLRSTQAVVTFDSEDGVTYLVQAGGFDYRVFFPDGTVEWGVLKLAVR